MTGLAVVLAVVAALLVALPSLDRYFNSKRKNPLRASRPLGRLNRSRVLLGVVFGIAVAGLCMYVVVTRRPGENLAPILVILVIALGSSIGLGVRYKMQTKE